MGARTIYRHHSNTQLARIQSVRIACQRRENRSNPSEHAPRQPHEPAAFQRAGVLLAYQLEGPELEIGQQVLPQWLVTLASWRREECCPLCLSFIDTHILAPVPLQTFFHVSHRAKAFRGV
ncbi:hypothetical protein CROQUDRAFT_98195 [Cronartium quercuum f. sp. fusiforme G11]|uniref:Uncharacterized protein n=1 Tax=Cronartium quercuum f. sp. fusiforme G11 TaxID=708437 RepID=A0A9P6NDS4_9BASI|nr:hypothetical protein CROQUDRAFT_98195 [Cronartium quercuum f. sp. fusiforme G11]